MAGRRVLIRECVHDAYLWSAEDGRTINGRTTWAMRGRVPQVAYADTRIADFSMMSSIVGPPRPTRPVLCPRGLPNLG